MLLGNVDDTKRHDSFYYYSGLISIIGPVGDLLIIHERREIVNKYFTAVMIPLLRGRLIDDPSQRLVTGGTNQSSSDAVPELVSASI
jgi:hypothetical protein